MNQKERLVDALDNAFVDFIDFANRNPAEKTSSEFIADYILDDGWMRPPCKVGTNVYTIQNGEVKKHFVMEVSNHINGNSYIQYVPYDKNGIAELNWVQSQCTDKDIGKTVFLTREDAENALRKDEGK